MGSVVGPHGDGKGEAGKLRAPKSPVGRSHDLPGWARRAATRGWSPAHLRLAALCAIVRPHSQSRALVVPVMIGIRVMVQILFPISGYLVLTSKRWQSSVRMLGCWERQVDFTVLAAWERGSCIHVEQKKSLYWLS